MASTSFESPVHHSQPTAIPSLEAHQGFGARAASIKKKLTTRRGWLGDYDYAWLCLPTLPFARGPKRPPPFYALDAELPLTLAIFTGFQHALAMLAGTSSGLFTFQPFVFNRSGNCYRPYYPADNIRKRSQPR